MKADTILMSIGLAAVLIIGFFSVSRFEMQSTQNFMNQCMCCSGENCTGVMYDNHSDTCHFETSMFKKDYAPVNKTVCSLFVKN